MSDVRLIEMVIEILEPLAPWFGAACDLVFVFYLGVALLGAVCILGAWIKDLEG